MASVPIGNDPVQLRRLLDSLYHGRTMTAYMRRQLAQLIRERLGMHPGGNDYQHVNTTGRHRTPMPAGRRMTDAELQARFRQENQGG